MIICHFSSFFDTPSLQCAGSRYLSSGASQMDFSAGGDFPSIAVSINHQHLHHYLTLRTEKKLRITKFPSELKKIENYQVCLRWVLVSTQALVRSRHLVTWSLWQGGDMSTSKTSSFLSLIILIRGLGFAVVIVGLFLAFFYNVVVSHIFNRLNERVYNVFCLFVYNVQYHSKDNTVKLKCGPFLLVGSFCLVVWGF